jgi:hypothetical protein
MCDFRGELGGGRVGARERKRDVLAGEAEANAARTCRQSVSWARLPSIAIYASALATTLNNPEWELCTCS